MKQLMVLFLLVSNVVYANPLDTSLAKINASLNPQFNGDVGYELDYVTHESDGSAWVNISKVKEVCKLEQIFTIHNGSIITTAEFRCHNRYDSDNGKITLLQIMCKGSKRSSCITILAKEVTLSTVKQVIAQKIELVEVK